jgi:hypothetical protein
MGIIDPKEKTTGEEPAPAVSDNERAVYEELKTTFKKALEDMITPIPVIIEKAFRAKINKEREESEE